MESEVNLLRRRYLDSVQSNKSMKQLIRVQKDKSRQLIVACAYKLQEKEAEIKNVRFLLWTFFTFELFLPLFWIQDYKSQSYQTFSALTKIFFVICC